MLLVFLLVFSSQALAQVGTWATKTSMPTPRSELSTSVVNGVIYAVGGAADVNLSLLLGTVEAYDPATDTWTPKASMPTPRYTSRASVVNGVIYVVGGWNGSYLKTVEAYDPVTNAWTTKASMLTPRSSPSTSVVNGVLYVMGGGSFNGSRLATVEAYDPTTNIWTPKASMPSPHLGLGSSVVNGVIYAIGGVGFGSPLGTVEAYDPASDTWTTKTSMPTARVYLSTSAVNGVIYAVGGQNDLGFGFLGTLEAFTAAPPIVVSGLESPLAALVPEGDSVPVPDNAFKRRRTLPMRLQISSDGVPLTDADSAPRIVGLVRIGDPPLDLTIIDLDAGQANDNGVLFRFEDGFWVYNLSTNGLAIGTYTITIEMPYGQRHTAGFVLR